MVWSCIFFVCVTHVTGIALEASSVNISLTLGFQLLCWRVFGESPSVSDASAPVNRGCRVPICGETIKVSIQNIRVSHQLEQESIVLSQLEPSKKLDVFYHADLVSLFMGFLYFELFFR